MLYWRSGARPPRTPTDRTPVRVCRPGSPGTRESLILVEDTRGIAASLIAGWDGLRAPGRRAADLQGDSRGPPVVLGKRHMRAQHQPLWLRQFVFDAFIVREDGVFRGYLLGAVTTHGLAYVHLIATRTDQRGRGVGGVLYETFLSHARRRGARQVEAVTATTNTGSRTSVAPCRARTTSG
jgi:ribosomal protein S18 acetylase RimI-like enzyme